MKTCLALALIVLLGASCNSGDDGFDPEHHTFVDVTDGSARAVVLSASQAATLVSLIRRAQPERKVKSGPANTNNPPALAPSLCVNVYRDTNRTEWVGQILGFDRKWIIVGPDIVIAETNTVNAVYRAVGW